MFPLPSNTIFNLDILNCFNLYYVCVCCVCGFSLLKKKISAQHAFFWTFNIVDLNSHQRRLVKPSWMVVDSAFKIQKIYV